MARILVVDDEGSVRSLLELTLTTAGHEVEEAANGTEALEKITAEPFDVVVLDIMMPGLSGYDVLDRLREIPERADTPVIVVTAKHDPEGVLRETQGGAVDHIAKPFRPEELEAAIERALEAGFARKERQDSLRHQADLYGSLGDLVREVREQDEEK